LDFGLLDRPMCNLLHYFAGGLAALLALECAAPLSRAAVNLIEQSSLSAQAASTLNVVDRANKSDRLAEASPGKDQDTLIATVEVSGIRDVAVVYRARNGRILFHTDPATNATVVAKGVVLPEVTVRDTRAKNAATPAATESVLSAPQSVLPVVPAPTAPEPKILEGCDPAFSSLATARANFSTRCLASKAPATKFAAAFPNS
jgi:hypothetical protein